MTICLYPNKNRSLAAITTKRQSKWLYVKTPNLPKTLRSQLEVFYRSIAGKDFDEETTTLACKFDRNTETYVQTYAPAIYKDVEGNPVVCWGNELFVLTNDLIKDLDVEVRIEELEQYKETCLIFVAEVGDDYLELPMKLSIAREHKDVPLATYKKLIKQVKSGKGDIAELAPFLWERVIKEGGNSDFAPTYGFKELAEDTDFRIVSYEYKKFETHHNYILTLINAADNSELKAWAPAIIRNAIDFGAELTMFTGDNTDAASSFKYIKNPPRKPNGKPEYIVIPTNIVFPEDDEQVSF